MSVSQEVSHLRYEGGRLSATTTHVVREGLVRLHVNGQELAMMMCTPVDLDLLAVGFLRGEGIIEGLSDVRRIVVCPSGACVEVWLWDARRTLPAARVLTSGCGGGITFADLTERVEPLDSTVSITADQLGRLLFMLQEGQRIRGIHTAALSDGERLLAVAEDVGRHNAIDKLWGRCLVEGIATQDRIVLTTGRISSEMLRKAARMRAPIVASRTSPTTLTLALAEAWNVTVVGYVRRGSLNVYTGLSRVLAEQ